MKETDLGQHVWLAERSALSQWQLHSTDFFGFISLSSPEDQAKPEPEAEAEAGPARAHTGLAKPVAEKKHKRRHSTSSSATPASSLCPNAAFVPLQVPKN